MENSAGRIRAEEGDKTPSARAPDTGETEESPPPPEQSRALNASGRLRREGGGGHPTQQRTPTACSKGKRNTPQHSSMGPPLRERDHKP